MKSEGVVLITTIIPALVALAAIVGVVYLCYYLLIGRQTALTGDQKMPRQVGIVVLCIVGLVTFVLFLPVSVETRNQIIALIGVVLSGMIAFSSTSIMSNLMAGIVLRINRPFRIGDFIRVHDHAGRVTEMGILDTEVQTEKRELIAFANNTLITSPVTVVRSSGAIISVELSLGYEIFHGDIEAELIKAAESIELEEPFVQITQLGDFSVSYRVAGLLKDVKSMLGARSRLHKAVLDHLHQAGIEIVSPSFMNQRAQQPGVQMIPRHKVVTSDSAEEGDPDAIVFDKAQEAEQQESKRQQLENSLAELEEQLKTAEGELKESLKSRREQLKIRLAELV
ncbi:mechanosensitive ion channel family protein [Alteromonas aestuariivivens]|uniref:Small-conductance mechanosensitive channel n=1 Tax=Alteromonas aestuariivivens TaxID=1938339 RepID=A0A3D8M9C2_9ALTE|nr:mechanosensitive ion channel domain-containing protein [Alteromonas aestuariivivens]RDV26633.1 mechanosensitive ion channel family protein [Alteromonas aestuariivivens]